VLDSLVLVLVLKTSLNLNNASNSFIVVIVVICDVYVVLDEVQCLALLYFRHLVHTNICK